MKIIKYTNKHKKQFINLYKETFINSEIYQEIWTDNEVEKILLENETFVMINNDDNIIAFICGYKYTNTEHLTKVESQVVNQKNIKRSFYISELVTAKKYRGNNYAYELIRFLIQLKINAGFTNFILHTRLNNPVRKLYERIGFIPIYDNNGEIIITNTESKTTSGEKSHEGLNYILSLPILSELKETFNLIKEKKHNNAKGVFLYDTGIEGPTLGITMCTHGDEPAGLAILWYFLKYNLFTSLKKGKLFFVIQNISATEGYFNNLKSSDRDNFRFTDINYNRLPENSLELTNSNKYEIKRLQELYKIYQKFTHGYDIHTSEDEVPMIITGNEFYPDLVKGFPIEVVLTNIAKPQIGFPSFEFFGGLESNIPVFEIEAGTNESPLSFWVSIQCALSLLKNLDMLEGTTKKAVKKYKEYFIYDTIVFPNDSFRLSKIFDYYEPLKKGQNLGKGMIDGKEKQFICKEDGHAIFPPLNKLIRDDENALTEEQMFISRKVRPL